jgi:hypothetical protein
VTGKYLYLCIHISGWKLYEMYFSHYVYLFSILNILCDGRSTSTTPVPTCAPDNSHTDRWSQEDFPNPQIDISKCGRNCKASWICDPGHILSSDGGMLYI